LSGRGDKDVATASEYFDLAGQTEAERDLAAQAPEEQ